MSNLTKYDVLKHRHLSLLQELEKAGVSANYSQIDGEWKIGIPQPVDAPRGFKVTGLTNQQLAEHLVRHGTKDAEDVYDCLGILLDKSGAGTTMEEIVKHYCVTKMQGHAVLSEACKHMGIAMLSDGTWRHVGLSVEYSAQGVAASVKEPTGFSFKEQQYAEGVWTQTPNGEVNYHHAPPHHAPQWVQDQRAKWGMPPNAIDPQMRQQDIEFVITVLDTGHIDFHGADYTRTVMGLTTVMDHLLNALKAAIVAASPAKVD